MVVVVVVMFFLVKVIIALWYTYSGLFLKSLWKLQAFMHLCFVSWNSSEIPLLCIIKHEMELCCERRLWSKRAWRLLRGSIALLWFVSPHGLGRWGWSTTSRSSHRREIQKSDELLAAPGLEDAFCWGLPSCSIPEPMRICSFIPWLYNCDPRRLILYFYLMIIMSNCNSWCFVHLAYSTPSYAYTPFLPLLLLLVLPLVCCAAAHSEWAGVKLKPQKGMATHLCRACIFLVKCM